MLCRISVFLKQMDHDTLIKSYIIKELMRNKSLADNVTENKIPSWQNNRYHCAIKKRKSCLNYLNFLNLMFMNIKF